jgi:amino acid permease
VILAIFTVQGITFEVARVHTVDFMQDESIELREYLMIRSFIISLAIILGGVSAMLLDYLDVRLLYILIYLTVLALFGIYLQYRLYKIFKKRIFLSDIKMEKDKKELYEKFR